MRVIEGATMPPARIAIVPADLTQAKLDGMQQARTLFEEAGVKVLTPPRAVARAEGDPRSDRIGAKWRAILGEMADDGGQFDYKRVLTLRAAHEFGLTDSAARTKLNELVHRGLVDRIKDGCFQVSERGASLSGQAYSSYDQAYSSDDTADEGTAPAVRPANGHDHGEVKYPAWFKPGATSM